MKVPANCPLKKKFQVLIVTTLLIVLASPVHLLCISQVAEATDFTSLRSWVNVETPYYGEKSILVKMIAVTIGNQLNRGMWIDEISNTQEFAVNVVVGRAVIEAEYSSDSNTTTFIYTVSSSQYEIAPFGDFPNDFWRIGITFHTNFTAQFDPRIKYCTIPSPNYYGRYNTTYLNEEQGYHYYSLDLEILFLEFSLFQ